MAFDPDDWRIGLANARNWGYHGSKFIEPTYKKIKALPAVYNTGSMGQIESKSPSLEFDSWTIGGSAMEAMKMIVGVAFGGGGKGLIPSWVASQVPNQIGWNSQTAAGMMDRTVLEFYTPIKETRHLLFSAEITKHELEIENHSTVGIDWKKFRLSNLKGTYGVLYFSTNPNDNLFE